MGKYTNENGETVEAFTQEELDAKIAEAKAGFDTTIAEKETKLTELQKELEEAKKTPPKKGEKENPEVEALKKQIEDLTSTVKGNTKNELLDKLSGGDKDLRAQIELEYSKFAQDPTDKAAIEEQVLKSYRLVNPEATPSNISEAISYAANKAGGVGQGNGNESTGITDSTKAQGKEFGISEADYAKYGGAINNEVKN